MAFRPGYRCRGCAPPAFQRHPEAPALICYLDRGVGAAIRRARTRLPGGGDNPVSIIKVPRERMVGSGIASSLIHEVGHQGAAMLGPGGIPAPDAARLGRGAAADAEAWQFWDRWISEIVADFWSVARVGVTSTMGLMGVVSLPRPFVFRINRDDPHPTPWIRVKLSAAIGKALYPQTAWDRLATAWQEFYPLDGLPEEQRRLIDMLERTMPGLVTVLVNLRPAALRGRLAGGGAGNRATAARQAARAAGAVAGAAAKDVRRASDPGVRRDRTRAGGWQGDSRRGEHGVGKLLSHWALRSTLEVTAACASAPWRAHAGASACAKPEMADFKYHEEDEKCRVQ